METMPNLFDKANKNLKQISDSLNTCEDLFKKLENSLAKYDTLLIDIKNIKL